jgi:hypothetical protein
MGLTVTAKQQPYHFELSTSELLAHSQVLQEYREELSHSLYTKATMYKPDLGLIKQQPELKPSLRGPILEFLLHLSIKTKVTTGIYYQAVRIFDRYSSKRVVLREQLQLVLATCLWLSAKTYGGCNHIINNTTVPTGGRFHGPNPRARIPRLNELCLLCNDDQKYDEGMFIQMERHILDTLNWNITEPLLFNWILNFYENNLIQFEQHQLDDKICIINIKKFLAESSLFELKLMELHPSQLAQVILNIMSMHTSQTFQSELDFLQPLNKEHLLHYTQILCDTVLQLPDSIVQYYKGHQGVSLMYDKIVKHCIKVDTDFNTPIKMLPTPPSSRRGSPVGTIMD